MIQYNKRMKKLEDILENMNKKFIVKIDLDPEVSGWYEIDKSGCEKKLKFPPNIKWGPNTNFNIELAE